MCSHWMTTLKISKSKFSNTTFLIKLFFFCFFDSALNVRDLDTIDYGIIKNIFSEVKRKDWSILIAHFLGVDHCGHRYGTHHPEMTRKINEMDKVIK